MGRDAAPPGPPLAALPEPPPEAGRLFGDRLPLAQRYAELLATDGLTRGLLGPREVARVWPRHLLNCVAAAELVAPDTPVLDLGSGAGLPGIVWAIARPDLTVTLVEPAARRTGFLEECVDELALDGVRVVRARAEELAGVLAAPVVTARAVAPLDRLLGWALPLVAVPGELLALKGARAATELAAAGPVLAQWQAQEQAQRRVHGQAQRRAQGPNRYRVAAEVVTCGRGLVPEPTTVVRVRLAPATSATRGRG